MEVCQNHQWTPEYRKFCDYLDETHACVYRNPDNNKWYATFRELDGKHGKELDQYCEENGILHPVWRTDCCIKQEIELPKVVCSCCKGGMPKY